MSLLVTGATGFIGSSLCHNLTQETDSLIIALVREGSNTSRLPAGLRIIRYSEDTAELVENLRSFEVSGIVHLASLFIAEHESGDIGPLIESNITLGTKLLEAARHAGVQWFINVSSFWQHYNNMPYLPASLYAATKQAFEEILQYYAETSSMRCVTLELFDTYGPGDPRPKLFNLLKKAALSENPLPMSPGHQRLNLVYVKDVVDAFCRMSRLITDPAQSLSAKYCVAAPESFTLRSVVELFARIAKRNLDIQWGGRKYRAGEIMDPRPLFETVPMWSPCYSLEQGICELLIQDGLLPSCE